MTYTFADLFAGIGGFHLAFHNLGARCSWVSEIDQHARKTYETNFKSISPEVFDNNLFFGDIKEIDEKKLPNFDIICGGFPCQPFSHAGFKKGFEDLRGTLFFDIARIIKEKRPQAFFLENVSHFKNHDEGRTFETIKKTLEDLGYSFYAQVIKAQDYGVPQRRPRLFMVGFSDPSVKFSFPDPIPLKMTMSDIFGGECPKKIGFTLRVGGRGSGLHDRRNWDSYLVDGKEKRLTTKEGKKMMGYPQSYLFPVTETQAMKQLGNSVAVPAVQATAKNLLQALKDHEKNKPTHRK